MALSQSDLHLYAAGIRHQLDLAEQLLDTQIADVGWIHERMEKNISQGERNYWQEQLNRMENDIPTLAMLYTTIVRRHKEVLRARQLHQGPLGA